MPITVVVRSMAGDESRLTFDGSQRVVIGRGAGSDVRLPDPSVSHRHASVRSQGSDFVVVDEGSTNGTFVGEIRVAAGMSRIVRSGDWVRVGRLWLQLVIDHRPITRDLAMATRDLALAFVARAMEAGGLDRTIAVRVVEGQDQGTSLALADPSHGYLIGRGPHCEMPLADADASREHVRVTRKEGVVVAVDLGAKNGTWLGGARLSSEQETTWRPAQMLKVGRTVLALVEPVADALAAIESVEDELVGPDEASAGPPPSLAARHSAPAGLPVPADAKRANAVRRSRWSPIDWLVMGAALGVLALSLVGLFWLLRGGAIAPGR